MAARVARVTEIIGASPKSFEEAIAGTAAPQEVIENLCLLDVSYYSFDGELHLGQLLAGKPLRRELEDIFSRMRDLCFPVERAIPIVRYAWSDSASMADNNTSCFNYRFIHNTTRLSRHAHGTAIDINPRQNPVVYKDGTSLPTGAVYSSTVEGAFSPLCPILGEFRSRGWKWGGDLTDYKDYHHFEKLP
jgi:flavin-binding protein dodecin